jgi:hypothetical protein
MHAHAQRLKESPLKSLTKNGGGIGFQYGPAEVKHGGTTGRAAHFAGELLQLLRITGSNNSDVTSQATKLCCRIIRISQYQVKITATKGEKPPRLEIDLLIWE